MHTLKSSLREYLARKVFKVNVRFYMFKGPELWVYGSSSEFLCFFLCNALGIPESMAGNKLELF